jgi:hypothetical protein
MEMGISRLWKTKVVCEKYRFAANCFEATFNACLSLHYLSVHSSLEIYFAEILMHKVFFHNLALFCRHRTEDGFFANTFSE